MSRNPFFRPRPPTPRRHRLCRPTLEILEPRLAPATVFWVAGDGDWGTPGNWSTGQVPQSGDDVFINTPGITVTHGGSLTDAVNSLVCTPRFVMAGGGLVLTQSSHIEGTLSLIGGTLSPLETLTLGTVFDWSGGTLGDPLGVTTVLGSAVMHVQGTVSLKGTLTNQGNATLDGFFQLQTVGPAVINNGATATFALHAGTLGSAGATFNNSGTVTRSGDTGTTTLVLAFNNRANAMVQVQAGTLNLQGGGDESGTFTVAAGATLAFGAGGSAGDFTLEPASSVSGAGIVAFHGSGTDDLRGDYNVSGSTSFGGGYGPTVNVTGPVSNFGSTVAITGTVHFDTGGPVSIPTLNLSFGTLAGSDPVTITDTFNWSGGSIANSAAPFTVPAGAALNLNSNLGGLTLDGRSLTNAGQAVLHGGLLTLNNGAVFNNQAGATFDFQDDSSIFAPFDGTTFNNAGRLTKSSGTFTSALGPAFHNTGSVQVQAGTLALEGGGDAKGTFTVAKGATLNLAFSYQFQPETFVLQAGSSVSGPGNVLFGGADVTVAGTYNIGGTTSQTFGSATFTTPVANLGATLSLSGGTMTLNGGVPLTVATLNLAFGTLMGSDPLTVTGSFLWSAGTLGAGGPVTVAAGASLNITFFVTLDGRTLNNAGTATWGGNGELFFKNGAVFDNEAGATFTNTTDLTLSGDGTATFRNAGTFIKAGGTATTAFTGVAFQNTGTVRADSGTLSLGDLTVDGSGSLLGQPGAILAIGGNLTGTTRNAELFAPQATVLFDGSAFNPQLLEAMSRDLGNTPAGFSRNFAYQTLAVGQSNSGASVRLVDNARNSTGTGSEALYVNTLLVPSNSTLDLNGLHLYARFAQVAGAVVGGTVAVLPDGGPVSFNSAVPGSISATGEADDWTFFARAGQVAAVIVHTGSSGLPAPAAPPLNFAQVSLVDPGGKVLATASNTQAGADITLEAETLPADGTYHVRVAAPGSQPSATGNYVLTLLNAPPLDAALTLNQRTNGKLETVFSVDHWHFTALAGQQVQFQLRAADSGVQFDLTGPGGFVGFTNATADSSLLTLPTEGEYTLTAHTDLIHKGAYAFELDASLIDLALGTPLQGAIGGSGQTQLFRVHVPAASPLQVVLHDSTSGDHNEVYVRFGAAPTRGDYDYRFSNPASANQIVTVPRAAAGEWYILLYTDLAPAPSTFNLEATTSSIALTSVRPRQNGTTTDAVLYLTGAGFNSTTALDLVATDGTVFHAGGVQVDSPTAMTATFPAGTAPAGTYAVRTSQINGDTAELPAAFTAVEGAGKGVLTTNLVVPDRLAIHLIPATIYVEYSNTGSAPLPSPLLVLKADQGANEAAFLTLDATRVVSGIWNNAIPAGFGSSVQFLASGATPGVLAPGETVQVPVYWAGWLASLWSASIPIIFNLEVLQPDDTTPLDWAALRDGLRPDGINADAWAALYPNLTARLGSTSGAYLSRLDADAQYLAGVGENVTDISRLYAFEVEQAIGLSPVQTLTSAVDMQLPAPGLSLSVSRTFTNSIIGRYHEGPFGRGWSWDDGWDRRLTVLPDGTVSIMNGTGAVRRFQPDRRGGFFDQSGDHATLTDLGGGAYTLQELNGLLAAFNAEGTVHYVQDLNGNRITAGFEAGLLTSLMHSSGQVLHIHYNAAGRIDRVSDPASGRSATYTYDAGNEHLLTATGPDGLTTTYTYSVGMGAATEHALTSVASPADTHQLFVYNLTTGQLKDSHRDGGAEEITYSYGPAVTVAATDASGGTTTYSFDDMGMIAKVADPLHHATLFSFDMDMNVTQVTDPAGQSYNFIYDSNGNLIRSSDPLGRTNSFSFSAPFDRLASVTDGNDNVTQYGYDANGNHSSTTYADGSLERAAYDAFGDPMTLTTRRGHTIQLTYDLSGRLHSKTFADSTQITYEYDGHGNLKSATDASGTTTLTYTGNDRLMQITYPGGRFLQFAYDPGGRRTQMVDQDGFTVNYSYDAVGRLAKLADASNNLIVAYTYDLPGRLMQKDMGNGTRTTYHYDLADNLLHLVNLAPDHVTVNSQFDYTYDNLGRRTTMTTLDGQWAYTYDALGQLTHALFTSNNPATLPNQDLQYVYDAAGDRTQTIINGVTTTYVSNNLNQYTKIGTTSLAYDSDGNLISQTDATGTTSYAYNDANQLTNVATPDGSNWNYRYDAIGNRTSTTNNSQQINYLVDPSGLGNVVGEYNPSGNLIDHYVHGVGLTSRIDNTGAAAYYDFDGIGSTVGLSGSAGIYINRYSYLPFGEQFSAAATVANPFGYVGQFGVMQDGNGLDFMRERYHLPVEGQFTSIDPLRIGPALTLYSYAANNPITRLDPTGSSPCDYIRQFEEQSRNSNGRISPWQAANNARFVDPMNIDLSFAEHYLVARDELAPVVGEILTAGYDVVKAITQPFGAFSTATPPSWNSFLWGEFGLIDRGRGRHLCDLPPAPSPDPCSCNGGGSRPSAPVGSFDPNAKFGPAGFGPQGFVAPDQVFPYRIDFENDPQATAPAQRVVVTDPLDAHLDWNTFQLTGVGFGDNNLAIPAGSQHFQTTVPMTFNGQSFDVQIELGLNAQTGLVTATFQSIDPRTDLPPDVLTGFLPPEDGTGRGMGYFSYVVRPKAELPTGIQIRNVASVVFDANPAITTDQVDDEDASKGTDPAKQDLNTIDAGPPTSHVTPLPAVTNSASFSVSWSGQDDAGGSGIGSFDVYVSVDGGAFSRWLAGTAQTSATYTGSFGHSYAFYSVATDNVGHQEALPTAAEATTLLVAPPQPPRGPLSGDVTAVVRVAPGKATHRGRRSRQMVTLTNTSSQALAGPVSLVLVGLPRKVRVLGASGRTQAGSPFVDLGGLVPGGSVTLLLQFSGPVPKRLSYTVRVIAGTGPR